MTTTSRRDFLKLAGLGALGLPFLGRAVPGNIQPLESAKAMADKSGAPQRPNIVFITADDMNFDSSNAYGGPIKDLTPNLNRLAEEGLRFQQAYSTVAVCQPVREIMHTGLYPHRNGAMGFFPLKPEIRTLNQQLHDAGYLISRCGGTHPH